MLTTCGMLRHGHRSLPVQASWDDLYKNWYPLWRAYHHCVDHSRKRNAKRRLSSFKQLELPGQPPFHFSKESRKALEANHPAIINHIRSASMSETLTSKIPVMCGGCLLSPLHDLPEASLCQSRKLMQTLHSRKWIWIGQNVWALIRHMIHSYRVRQPIYCCICECWLHHILIFMDEQYSYECLTLHLPGWFEKYHLFMELSREMNTMDTALYERGKQLLEAKLTKHRQGGVLTSMRSMQEANLPEILQREAALQGSMKSQAGTRRSPQHRSRPSAARDSPDTLSGT